METFPWARFHTNTPANQLKIFEFRKLIRFGSQTFFQRKHTSHKTSLNTHSHSQINEPQMHEKPKKIRYSSRECAALKSIKERMETATVKNNRHQREMISFFIFVSFFSLLGKVELKTTKEAEQHLLPTPWQKREIDEVKQSEIEGGNNV